jgi:hypothetical protein
MQQFQFIIHVSFSEDQASILKKKFSKIFTGVRTGNRNNFDEFCKKIFPFCMEIYEMGKDLSPFEGNSDLPHATSIFSVGAIISSNILPLFKSYSPKSNALHEMACNVIGENKFEYGRISFLKNIWPITKRIEGVHVKKLIAEPVMGGYAIDALLKFKDGRFVEEAKEYQSRFPNDWNKKRIALYIERYAE